MKIRSVGLRRSLRQAAVPVMAAGSSLILAFACSSGSRSSSSSPSPVPPSSPNPTDNGGTATTNNGAALAADPELSTAVVATQLDDAASSLNAGDGGKNAATASLAGAAADVTRKRTCTLNGAAAHVEIDYSGSGSITTKRLSISESAGGSETRDWTNSAGTAVGCTKDELYAKVDWTKTADVNGLTLADATKRKRTLTTTFTTLKGASATRSVVATEDGTRNVVWATPSGATSTATTTKTVKSSVAYTYNLTRFNGKQVDLAATHATLDADPLVVTVTRDAEGVPETHTIESGTMTATKASGFYVTNKFDKVEFDVSASNTDPCTPVSGTITTNIYASNSATDTATPLKTLTITFADAGATVTDDATATDDLKGSMNSHCDFVGGD